MNEVNKYKKNNEMFDKLIHFTNINERKHLYTSESTSNIKWNLWLTIIFIFNKI
jgi:hypothetical protein